MFIQLGHLACVGKSISFNIVMIQLQASKQVLRHYFDTWHLYFLTCLEYTISSWVNEAYYPDKIPISVIASELGPKGSHWWPKKNHEEFHHDKHVF